MHIAVLYAKPHAGADSTGSEELHRTKVIETIEDAPHGIIGKGLRGYCLAQEELGVLLGKELFSTVEWATATERIQHQAKHDRARVQVHLRGYTVIDKANETQLVSIGLDNRQMVDGIDLDSRRYGRHKALRQRIRLAASGWLHSF